MKSNLEALVLNADYRPVTVFPLSKWDFERTTRNVMLGRVTVLECYDVELRSQRQVYRPASVVALISYAKTPKHVPFTRMNIFLRDGFCCQYCGGRFESNQLTFDHVVPRMAGGLTTWENITSACMDCNSRKGHRRDMRPMRPPREPTVAEMIVQKNFRPDSFPTQWLDYLYWSGVLFRDA